MPPAARSAPATSRSGRNTSASALPAPNSPPLLQDSFGKHACGPPRRLELARARLPLPPWPCQILLRALRCAPSLPDRRGRFALRFTLRPHAFIGNFERQLDVRPESLPRRGRKSTGVPAWGCVFGFASSPRTLEVPPSPS